MWHPASSAFATPRERRLVDDSRPPPLEIAPAGFIVPPHHEPNRMPGTGVVFAAFRSFPEMPQDAGEPFLVKMPPEIGGGHHAHPLRRPQGHPRAHTQGNH